MPENGGQQGGGQPGPSTGTVTAVGNPDGAMESKVIGVNGGTFTTADGRLSINFPQGALSSDNTITVQPITNNTPGGAGNAYRITPHNVSFAKPVSITFNYSQEDLSKTIPGAMAIAYQDAKGVWQAVGGGSNDTTAKKVTVNTTHFSDWSMFMMYEMEPNVDFVDPGGSTILKVIKRINTDDLIVPIPAGPVTDSIEAEIKEWKLAGPGTLSPNANIALYTAPSTIPDKLPVAVTAELKTKTGKYLYVANIYIGGEGVTFRIDKGPWKHGVCQAGVKMISTPLGDERFFTAAIPGTGNGDGVTFHWMGHPKVGGTDKWTLQFPNFQYSYKDGSKSIYYFQYALPSGTASAGGIRWTESVEMPTYYTSGVFTINTSGKLTVPSAGVPPTPTNHNIEGFFRIPWGGN